MQMEFPNDVIEGLNVLFIYFLFFSLKYKPTLGQLCVFYTDWKNHPTLCFNSSLSLCVQKLGKAQYTFTRE